MIDLSDIAAGALELVVDGATEARSRRVRLISRIIALLLVLGIVVLLIWAWAG